jgi:SagB-type dehydrogenase family enzyme
MKIKTILIIFVIPIIVLSGILIYLHYQNLAVKTMNTNVNIIQLPEPERKGKLSFEETINQRRSVREYKDEPLTLSEVSQLLWSAQGLNAKGSRVVPSAGALYPLEIYLVVKNVEGLPSGVYHYLPNSHSLEIYLHNDIIERLTEAALEQEMIREAAVNIIISGIFERTAVKYGERAVQYVYQESGHVSQNIYLECESLGLGTVSVGGFDQKAVDQLLGFPEGQMTLYIMPVGRR